MNLISSANGITEVSVNGAQLVDAAGNQALNWNAHIFPNGWNDAGATNYGADALNNATGHAFNATNPANSFSGSGAGLTGLNAVTNAVNIILALSSATNCLIDLNGHTTNNTADLGFILLLTTNVTIGPLTNAAPFAGKGFTVEVQQGALSYTLAYNTNNSANCATIVPQVAGQFLTMPTNSISCRMFLYFQISSSGTNAYLLGQSPVLR